MKTSITNIFIFLLLFSLVISCKKEAITNAVSQVATSKDETFAACINGNWTGSYATDGKPFKDEKDIIFIKNGIAQLTNSPWPNNFYTSVDLQITKCHQFSGDSAKLVAYLKNPSGLNGSIADYDVSLWLEGAKDTAHVQLLANLQQYTSLQVGHTGVTNVPQLVHLFQDWTELSLQAKNNKLSVYINGVKIEQFIYAGKKIGTLKSIKIGFKGSGSVEWVKLYNSNGNILKMEEDFNIKGQSNVKWY